MSGGGSGSATYSVTVAGDIANGSVTVTPRRASGGQTVTIMATPDEGYEVEQVTVTGIPSGAAQNGTAIFYNDSGAEISQPENIAENIGNTYKVRIYFKYDHPGEYRLPGDNDTNEKLPNGYTCQEVDNGEGFYIEHDYKIEEASLDRISIRNTELTFNAQNQVSFTVLGVPNDPALTVTYTIGGGAPVTLERSDGVYSGPMVFDAGTYQYTVTVSGDGYDNSWTETFDVVVKSRPIPAPTGIDGNYFPKQTHTGVVYGGNIGGIDYYKLSSNDTDVTIPDGGHGDATAINAGDYVVTAELTYPDSTYWAGNEGGSEAKDIQWSISPIEVPVPTAQPGLVYDNTLKTGITQSGNFTLEWSDDNSGNGTGSYKYGDNLTETAYTVKNGRATNGGTYTATAELAESGNYVWADKTTDDKKIEWTISPMPVSVADYVTVDAIDETYDGYVYDGEKNVTVKIASDKSDTLPVNAGVFDDYNISYNTTDSNAPTNAGSYTARVSFNLNEANAKNYSLKYPSGSYITDDFKITPVTLNMAFPKEADSDSANVTVSYSNEGYHHKVVKVSEVVEADKDKPSDELYTITYSYQYQASAHPVIPLTGFQC